VKSKRLENIINAAVVKANTLNHEYLTLECIFLFLLDDEEVQRVLEECGANNLVRYSGSSRVPNRIWFFTKMFMTSFRSTSSLFNE
jgi:ATP-dependent Clp protease ATP-binding subunit ClpA